MAYLQNGPFSEIINRLPKAALHWLPGVTVRRALEDKIDPAFLPLASRIVLA
jgi:hypothetical protein